jgi:peptidoglycan/xylan/chitin deacetylase (PgdA/CDA1 family)
VEERRFPNRDPGLSAAPTLRAQAGERVKRQVVRGICFHGIGRPERELEANEGGYWITVESFVGILDSVVGRPDVRITFDDGNSSDVEIALSALLDRGLVASFFVVAGRIGSKGSLDADGIRELSRQGMTIGTHGMDHRSWRGLAPPDRERELIEARERIAETVGRRVDEAALPMGQYDRRLLADLRRLGYSAVHTSERMPAVDGAWLQPRFSVHANDTVVSIERRALSDPLRARRAWVVAKNRLKRLR